MRRLHNPIDRHLFEGFHLRRLVLTNDQLSDAEFLARGDHDEIVLDNNEQLWSGSAASTSDRKRTRRLSLRNTSIDSLSQRGVDISQFADVEELILAGNELRAVSAAELGPFERLRVLDLSDNSVDQFAGNFSSVLPRLDTLNLTDNRLETLPESTWRPLVERLKSSVLLSGNRLHYNCEMRWLHDQKNLPLYSHNREPYKNG